MIDAGPLPLRRNRDFILLQIGQLLSTTGTQATAIAYPLLVLATTHSPTKAGVVGFANIVPYALFGLFAGVASDRWNRKVLMLVSDGIRIAAIASLVVVLAFGHLSFAQIAIVAFVEGSAFVFFNIAEVGALRSVVTPVQLPDAAAAEQARYAVVTLVGPSLGGALFGLGRAVPFLVDAVSYVFSFLSLAAIRTPFQEEREVDSARMRTQIADGFRFLWQQPFLRTCALIFAGSNFTFQGIFLVFVVAAKRHGLSSFGIGLCIGLFGACALVGSVASPLISRLLSMRAVVIVNLWAAAAILAFVIWPNVYVLLAAVMPTAFLIPALNSVVIGYRTAVTPDRLIGRVSSVARNLALLGQPLGPLVAGLLISSYSPRVAVLVFTAACAALALWGTFSPSIRKAPSLSDLATT